MSEPLARHLVTKGLLPETQVQQALEYQAKHGGTLDTALLEMHAVSEAGMLQAIADVSGIRLVNLADFEPNLDGASLMPAPMAEQLHAVPLSTEDSTIHLACSYPVSAEHLAKAEHLLGKKIAPWVALECRVRDWQSAIYGQPPPSRYDILLSQLDPDRPRVPVSAVKAVQSERISPEVLDRMSRGIFEEPIVLDKPKVQVPVPSAPSSTAPHEFEETRTVVAESPDYAKLIAATSDDETTGLTESIESESTRVMEIADYENYVQRTLDTTTHPAHPISVENTVPDRDKVSGPGGNNEELDFSALNEHVSTDQVLPLLAAVAVAVEEAEETPSTWDLPRARAALAQASHDRETLLRTLLDYASQTFEFAAFFAVVRGAAVGWDARPNEASNAIRHVTIPLDTPSVFRTVALTRANYVGPPPTDQHSQHYLSLFHRTPRTMLLWPIEVQSRLVAVVYGDSGTKPLSQRRLADFLLLCQELPQSFMDLLVSRKQSRKPTLFASSPSGPLVNPTPRAHEIESLIAQLTGPDVVQRKLARQQLLLTPEASARALAAAFPGPTGWSRLPVTDLPEADELGPIPGTLARLGPAGAFALAPLLTHLNEDTRYLAVLTAGSLPYSPVVPGLMQALFDEEPDLSAAGRVAARALRHLPEVRATFAELRRRLDTPDTLRQGLAARALGALRDRDSVDALIAMVASTDALCAQSAIEGLKEITRCHFGAAREAWAGWWIQHRTLRRAEWLVDALDAEEFDLRLSAFEELSAAFHEDFGYRPDSPTAERREAILRWRQAVERRPELTL